MPAVVTAKNTPGTHNNPAAGPFSEGCAGMVNKKWKTPEILTM